MKPASPQIQTKPGSKRIDLPATGAPVEVVLATDELFGRRRELVISHAGCLYRLRITQNNKLILTK
jgi:hemin uptake protein HemP